MVKKRVKQRRNNARQTQKSMTRTTTNNNIVSDNDETETSYEETNLLVENSKDAKVADFSQFPQPLGLQNLGNTCFFNSVMQNIWRTASLHAVLKHHKKLTDSRAPLTISPNEENVPSLTLTPGIFGPTTQALLNFMESAVSLQNTPTHTNQRRQAQRSRVISPKALFTQICNKNARFQGYQQQDSQELLHSLFDAVKSEDIKRKKLGILRAFNLERANAKDVDEETKRKIKAYGIEVSEKQLSLVDIVFGGTLLSSVLCDECGTVTGVTEPFCDISLPIIDDKHTFKHRHKTNGTTTNHVNGETNNEVSGKANNNTSTPESKHARKKAKREAKKQSRQNFRHKQQLINNTEKQSEDEGLACLASEIAESVLCDALSSLNLSHTEEQVNISPGEKKVKGGAVVATNVELPRDQPVSTCDLPPEGAAVTPPAHSSGESSCSEHENTTEKDSSSEVEQNVEINMSSPVKLNKKLTPESLFDTPVCHQVVKQRTSFCRDLPQSLGTRYQPRDQECSVESCLHQFTMAEMLTGSNMFGCETCTRKQNTSDKKKVVYCSASKQMMISHPPPVLIIHLKRFHQVGYNLRKVNKHVKIPLELNLAPFCTEACVEFADESSRILYHLYGIVEHSGSLSRGHYTAYVKVRPTNERLSTLLTCPEKCATANGEGSEFKSPPEGVWYHISDTIVSRSSQSKALSSNAYLLFYERLL